MDHGRAGAEAHPAVLALHHEYGWMDEAVSGGELWVARDGDEVVGAVELIELDSARVVVAVAVVGEARRGQGIGSELMSHVLGSRDAEWWTECRDQRIGFYERLGFQVVPAVDLPADVLPFLDHPSTTEPERPLNFLRRPGSGTL
ncbi:MAG: GNAT family N-acetyltransferase [Actinomycetota bacterium]